MYVAETCTCLCWGRRMAMKKFLSMLLALVMLIGMVPMNVLAVESMETGFEGKTISIR